MPNHRHRSSIWRPKSFLVPVFNEIVTIVDLGRPTKIVSPLMLRQFSREPSGGKAASRRHLLISPSLLFLPPYVSISASGETFCASLTMTARWFWSLPVEAYSSWSVTNSPSGIFLYSIERLCFSRFISDGYYFSAYVAQWQRVLVLTFQLEWLGTLPDELCSVHSIFKFCINAFS